MKKKLVLSGFAAAMTLTALLSSTVFAGADACVNTGVSVGGVDISGMTEEEAEAAIRAHVADMGNATVHLSVGDTQLEVTFNDLGLEWDNDEVMEDCLALGASGDILSRYKAKKDLEHDGRDFPLELTLDQKKAKAYVTECEQYNTEPVNATVYTTDELLPGIEGGTDGITLKDEDALKMLTEAAQSWDGQSTVSLELPVDVVKPEVSADDLDLSDVLGTATTDYSASTAGRAANVQNGCSKISGTFLKPGDWFSVTQALVPFTAENGYELAGSYEENQVVQSYGGGICQVSTTLYNAVLKAEMEVTERSNHSMVVNYVDLSKDAAIAEGVMDFNFVNNLDYPVYIIGYCYGGQINFTIYGKDTRPENRSIEFESRTISTYEPSGAKMAADPGQAVGYVNQTQSPHTGYYAELWKNIYVDGQLTDSVQINSSSYNAVGTVYDIGVATEIPALQQAMYTAIATGDINQVYAVVNNAASYKQTETESETQAQTETTAPANGGDEDDNITYDQYGNIVIING